MNPPPALTRSDIEDFLFAEADLLNNWRLPEWLALFTDDAVYYVPSTDLAPMASPQDNLFYIADDHFRLSERVKRLMKRSAHVEFPRSKTMRLLSNVRLLAQDAASLSASAAFITYRTKDAVTDTYFGTHYYQLARDAAGLKIREKRSMLASDGLRAQCRISIII